MDLIYELKEEYYIMYVRIKSMIDNVHMFNDTNKMIPIDRPHDWIYTYDNNMINRYGNLEFFLTACKHNDVKIVEYIFTTVNYNMIDYYIEDVIGYLLRDSYLDVSKCLIKNVRYDINLMDACCYHEQLLCAEYLYEQGFKPKNCILTAYKKGNYNIICWLNNILDNTSKVLMDLDRRYPPIYIQPCTLLSNRDPIDILIEYYNILIDGYPTIKCDICKSNNDTYYSGCCDIEGHSNSNNMLQYVMYSMKLIEYKLIIKPILE